MSEMDPEDVGTDIEGAYHLANTLVRECKEAMEVQALEMALTLLHEAAGNIPPSHELYPMAAKALGSALLVRHTCFGSPEDIVGSVKLLWNNAGLLGLSSLMIHQEEVEEDLSKVELALELMNVYRRSASMVNLKRAAYLYETALSYSPRSHPARPSLLLAAASTNCLRNVIGVDPDVLHRAVAQSKEALRCAGDGDRSAMFCGLLSLATTYCIQSLQDSNVKYARLAAAYLKQALQSDEETAALSDSGAKNVERFKAGGNVRDLRVAIAQLKRSVLRRQFPHGYRSISLNNLAIALSSRFECQGGFADLEQSIKLHREALELRPSLHPNRSTSLDNLASVLMIRFEHQGSIADLEESIKYHREALGLRPSPHPNRFASLSNLAIALSTRFEHRGGFTNLEESIKHHREALELQLPLHPNRSGILSNLAMALFIRFVHRCDFEDLEESIRHTREALGLRPSSHPDRSTSLSSLAAALNARFEHKDVLADLEESIKHNREALSLRPYPHPHRSTSLNNLAEALTTRFERRGVLADLEESIKYHREALALRPSPRPNRSSSLGNLAVALLIYDERQNGTRNQAEAFSLFEESVNYPCGPLFQRLRFASGSWAPTATGLNHPSALSAYQCAIHLLPQLASIDLDLQRRQDVLLHAKDLASNATRCAIEADRFEDAVVFSSVARTVFWSQSLQLRSPLDELELVASPLAAKLRLLSRTLEKRNLLGKESTGTPNCTNLDDKYASYFRGLAEDWQQTLEEVREYPGFEEFCKTPSFYSLRDCSKRGPVVLLNASARGCDALVITQDSGPHHIPLHGMTLDLLLQLSGFLHDLIAGKAIYVPTFLQNRDGTDCRKLIRVRKGRIDPEDQFAQLLGILWVSVVSPVIDLLKLKKSENPAKRMWWCPSGAFSFLPIHAAGIYTGPDPVCLHDYAVSSYCSSLQSLLTPVVPIEPDYKFLAIIEPQASGASGLPMTKVELEKIEAHLPQPHSIHLLKHVGIRGSPTSVNDVLSDLHHASFVHFGCHGKQASNPLESSLLLSGGELTMSSILQCQASKASLAYLSACQTAKHDKDRPDESLHLAATMIFAGFRSVVATLWSIYDRDAPVVADAFYGHLFRHGSAQVPDVTESAYALHLGVKALRDQGVGFLHWVPFVHYGS